MKRWRIPIVIAGLFLVGISAFFLQDVIRREIIIPVAYLLWLIKFYYTTIPQLFIWIILLVILLVVISYTLSRGFITNPRSQIIGKAISGSVENLADWINKSKGGNYFKWRIANKLGKLFRELDDDTDGSLKIPENIKNYLDAGINKSFVDYPSRSWFVMKKKYSPFDCDLDEVVTYLESLMEEKNELR